MKHKHQFRQGDVLIERVNTNIKPKTETKTPDRVILAYGEVTGHAHAIADAGESVSHVEIDEDTKAARLFILSVQTELQHQEHGAITLTPGNYKVIRQREYVPKELPRNVAD